MYIIKTTYLILLYINFILCHKHSKTSKNHIYSNISFNNRGTDFITPTTKYSPTDFYI